jgi:hypothetical protein
MVVTTAVNTCAIFGGSTYVNSWLPINLLILMVAFLIVAFVYTLSRMMTASVRGRISSVARYEIVQILISALIIVVVLGMATGACSISASFSQHFSGTTQDPFSFAEYNISTLAFHTGLGLYSSMFSTSMSYQAAAAIQSDLSSYALSTILTGIGFSPCAAINNPYFQCEFGLSANGPSLFNAISDLYLDVFTPLIMLSVGILFIQFLSLPFFEYMAFTVVLPVSLALRSLPFTGGGLKNVSNMLLAIAIAFYIIYPMMVAFNVWAVHWIYSTNNPLYPYLNSSLGTNAIPSQPPNFLKTLPTGSQTYFGLVQPTIWSVVNSTYFTNLKNLIPVVNIFNAETQIRITVNAISKYFFQTVVLFGIDVAFTVAFAASLARALNGGIEPAVSFWSGI